MAIHFAQLQNFALAGSGASLGATSITLKSMKDIDGNALSMATAFGTIGFGTLEPGNSTQEEQISFTGLVNNANGTTTLTGVSSVLFISPYTATSGLLKTHPGSTTFIISNTSGFYNQFILSGAGPYSFRFQKRVVTTTQSATPIINTDNTDVANITGLAQDITSMTTNLTGTPNPYDTLFVCITDDGTPRVVSWGAKFEPSLIALPTLTTTATLLIVGFLWNSVTSKWRIVGVV
jgi:hypothetical protein